jgi:hypothetical protein
MFQIFVLKNKSVPTKHAPDVWDSAAFSSIFLASAFSCSQAESTPAHTQVTQTVMPLKSIGEGYGKKVIVLVVSNCRFYLFELYSANALTCSFGW